jgi:hypothetical protein
LINFSTFKKGGTKLKNNLPQNLPQNLPKNLSVLAPPFEKGGNIFIIKNVFKNKNRYLIK